MTRFIIRRLIQSIPTFFGITLLSYIIMILAPGDPVSLMFFDPNTSQETRAAMADRLGVNDPLPMQYFRWLVGDDWLTVAEETWYRIETEDGTEGWLLSTMVNIDPDTGEAELTASRQPFRDAPAESANIIGRLGRRDTFEIVETTGLEIKGTNKGILRGDFGRSFTMRRPPLEVIWERLPASIELNVVVIVISVILGVTMGVLAAIWRGSLFDQGSRVISVIGDAIPSFWLAFLLILALAAPGLGLLPMGSRCGHVSGGGGCPPVYERLEYLVLPSAVLILGGIAGWSRYIRASMLENINSDYIRTAKSKGLPFRMVWFKHALRNALIPMATFLGPTFVGLLSGSVIIEQIFAWPGVGRLTLEALNAQDYPIVMATIVIGAILTILAYLVSDILYALFDPRIRL